MSGIHRAARRRGGLLPLRHRRLLVRRGVLLRTRAFSELGGIISDLAHPALDSFHDRGQLMIENFLGLLLD